MNRLEDPSFSRHKLVILEAGLFAFIHEELRKYFQKSHQDYLDLLKKINKEHLMVEEPLATCVIKDILASGMYTLSGIAHYTRMPEEVVFDIASGFNHDPSTTLFSKIIKLHQTVRPELYREILQQVSN